MPRAGELPEAIRPLARRNAVRLTHERFRADTQGLITALQKALEDVEVLRRRQKVETKLLQSWRPSKSVIAIAMSACIGLAMAGMAGWVIHEAIQAQREVTVREKTAVTPQPLSAAEERALRPKDTFKECSNCLEMIVVPTGSFMMGSPASEPGRHPGEGPQHTVTFARQFAVGQFELTFDEWDACVADGGCNGYKPNDRGWGRARRPVINVSWNEAKAYVGWLSKKTGVVVCSTHFDINITARLVGRQCSRQSFRIHP
jgi:formylglycine-generating enzyme required for sulfatase activity